jgi:DNA repair exonuclease SbcCD ATPase subunit
MTAGALALATLAGCSSTNDTQLPPQISGHVALAQLRNQLVQSKGTLQSTCEAGRDLIERPQADAKSQVDRLTRSIATLDAEATNNRTKFASAEEHAQAYFEHWNQELQNMSASLAEVGTARREASMKSFAELQTRVDRLKSEFRPMMAQFNEVSKYLAVDGTAEGVKTVTPQVKSAVNRENAVRSKADAVIEQIDAMRGTK